MALGAEQRHRPAEEPPLDAGLDEERQVGVTEHLEGDDRIAVARRPTLTLRESCCGPRASRELGELAGDAGLVLAHLERTVRWRDDVAGQGPALLAHR